MTRDAELEARPRGVTSGAGRKFRLGLRYIVLLMPAAVVFIALPNRWSDCSCAADSARCRSHRRHAPGVLDRAVPFSVYLFAAASQLANRYALRDQRGRERAERRPGAGPLPSLGAGPAPPDRGYTVAAILALLLLGGGYRSRSTGPSAPRWCGRQLRAPRRDVASPLAGASGRPPPIALVASAIAALRGGIVYVIVRTLRAPELKALFDSSAHCSPARRVTMGWRPNRMYESGSSKSGGPWPFAS